MQRFRAQGFPTTRDEDFRFTNVVGHCRRRLRAGRSAAGDRGYAEGAVRHRRARRARAGVHQRPVRGGAVVDRRAARGRARHQPGRGAGRRAGPRSSRTSAATIKFEMQAFTALNTALAEDGAVVLIPADVVVDAPDPPALSHRRGGAGGLAPAHAPRRRPPQPGPRHRDLRRRRRSRPTSPTR